jgi:hypothetical protein
VPPGVAKAASKENIPEKTTATPASKKSPILPVAWTSSGEPTAPAPAPAAVKAPAPTPAPVVTRPAAFPLPGAGTAAIRPVAAQEVVRGPRPPSAPPAATLREPYQTEGYVTVVTEEPKVVRPPVRSAPVPPSEERLRQRVLEQCPDVRGVEIRFPAPGKISLRLANQADVDRLVTRLLTMPELATYSVNFEVVPAH